MHVSTTLFIGIATVILTGCSTPSETVEFSDTFLDEIPHIAVTSTLINGDLECIYPFNLIATDSLLIVQEPSLAGEETVNALSLQGEKEATIIRRGQAPFEMPNLVARAILHPGDTLTAYDNPYLGYFPIAEILKKDVAAVKKLEVSAEFRSFAIVDVIPLGENLLARGTTPENRFIIMTPDSQYVSTDYFTPITDDTPEINASVWSYASTLVINPKAKRWAVGSYIGGCLDIFEFSGGEIRFIGGAYISKPIYDFYDSQANWTEETTIGFDDLSATDSKIYALYSGIKGKNLKTGTMPVFGNRIIVYDWDGHPVKVIDADCQIKTFAVSPDESMIYAVALNPDSMGWELRSLPLPQH